ncbi:MAG: choice-of-anchor Q domain-containing protein [Actinomycetota bacterium]
MKRPAALALLLSISAALLAADHARAATFVVTKTADTADGVCDRDCSLREAVDKTFFSTGSTVIVPNGVYTLTHSDGDLDVFSSTIQGSRSGATIIQGGPGWTDRVLDVGGGPTTIRDLTVRGGNVPNVSVFDNGGGIRVDQIASSLTLERVRIADNVAADNGGGLWQHTQSTVNLIDSDVVGNTAGANGGGVFNNGGVLNTSDGTTITDNVGMNTAGGIVNQFEMHLVDTLVAHNSTPAAGGGIVNTSGSGATITRSTIASNESATGSSGIWNTNGQLTITESTISDNTSTSAGSGLNVTAGDVTVDRSTVARNHADSVAGGIFGFGGSLLIRDSTVSGNTSDLDGGGVYVNGGTTTILRSTVAANTADLDDNGTGDGGGLARAGTGTINVKGSILADNIDESDAGNVYPDCSAAIVSGGFNVIEEFDGCSGMAGTDVEADAAVGVLKNNGGATETHEFFGSSSAALDGLPTSDTDCTGTDQRGVPRPVGSGCDAGSYEFVECVAVTVNVVGTEGDDVLTDTTGDDGILALGGNDVINASEGSDVVCAGAGNDEVHGGEGDDRLIGEAGKDKLFGDAGQDLLDGGAGRKDKCLGGPDPDTFVGCEKKKQQG